MAISAIEMTNANPRLALTVTVHNALTSQKETIALVSNVFLIRCALLEPV